MIFYDSRYEINRICIEVTRQALISVDPITARFFSYRYGFKYYTELPNPKKLFRQLVTYAKVLPDFIQDMLLDPYLYRAAKETPEYLYYLDVDSNAFKATFNHLAQASAGAKELDHK